jgi:hypothetical protein
MATWILCSPKREPTSRLRKGVMTMSDEMPEQPTTKELPAADPVQVLLIKIQRSMEAGFNGVGDRLDRQDRVLERVSSEGIEVNTRVARIEVRLEKVEHGVEDLEARVGRASTRVKQVSEQDLAQDAQLAQERAAREELAEKVDKLLGIGERLEKVTKNPTIKVLAGMLATAAITWLAAHNAGAVLPAERTATTTVVHVYTDAGAGQ